MVKQLIYKSQSVAEITPDLVNGLQFTAARFNKHRDITSILLHSDNVFLQFLEGAPMDIDDLYKRILVDPRHMNIRSIYMGYAEERSYPHWRMRVYSEAERSVDFLTEPQRSFIRSAGPLAGDCPQETIWIGPFMRSICKDHLPEKRPESSEFN